MILIDVAVVLHSLLIDLTPWLLSEQESGAQRHTFKQSSKSSEGLWLKQSLFAVGKGVEKWEVRPRTLQSQSRIPRVILGHHVCEQ